MRVYSPRTRLSNKFESYTTFLTSLPSVNLPTAASRCAVSTTTACSAPRGTNHPRPRLPVHLQHHLNTVLDRQRFSPLWPPRVEHPMAPAAPQVSSANVARRGPAW